MPIPTANKPVAKTFEELLESQLASNSETREAEKDPIMSLGDIGHSMPKKSYLKRKT